MPKNKKDRIVESICLALKQSGTINDFRYDHFRDDEAVVPPFTVYRRVAPTNFSADGIVYYHEDNVDLELYTEDPESMAELMAEVERLLDEADLFYRISADTVYIDTEELYESLYEV